MLGIDKLIEDEEQTEGIDRAGIEIVVAVFRIVEMEAGEPPGADEARNDLLDVGGRRVMAEIDEALGLRPKLVRRHQARSPI